MTKSQISVIWANDLHYLHYYDDISPTIHWDHYRVRSSHSDFAL